MATKPADRFAARPRVNARSTGSAKDAFIDPSSLAADEMSINQKLANNPAR